MKSLATNQRNDLFIDADGSLAIARDIEAVKQDCQHAMQAQLSEMVLAQDRGIPTMNVVWHNANLVQFEASARQTLRAVGGVVDVVAFEMSRAGDALVYTTTIQTIYGTASLTNG
ncbi:MULTISPECIES: hypothetical protein [Ralstonia solanacearum species complex]|uniref:hypothetical protein n=1 Tax=Ralstonia solanacearum species complex TaxID=3116862 RepID=UPI0018D029C1|nr:MULTISPECIES: hypothetical protein [Ralstonia solanacearum species complex]